MLVPVLLFILGLALLVKGGDWFVDGATGIAHHFHMPELLIGATVVSIGTTIPEVMVSSAAALQGNGSMAYGNAIGSIICNVSLIAAITMTFNPSKVERKSLVTPVLFFFVAAIFYAGVAYFTGSFSRIVGIILLAMFVSYMIVAIRQATKNPTKADESNDGKKDNLPKDIIMLIISAALIAVGANLLVDNGTIIAEKLGVPQTVIALTFVALGTSLPELVTAITALVKGHSALSLGNVIGANLFNLVLVSGMSIVLGPFELPCEKTIAGMNASLLIDVPLMFFVMLFMCLPALIKGKIYKWQGVTLILLYISYCVFQFFM